MNAEREKNSRRTGEPQENGSSALQPEFGRHQDVRRLFGIKRGILYRLMNEGKVRSITLREPGRRFGCRLIYLPSVRQYLQSMLEAQNGGHNPVTLVVQSNPVDNPREGTGLRLQSRM